MKKAGLIAALMRQLGDQLHALTHMQTSVGLIGPDADPSPLELEMRDVQGHMDALREQLAQLQPTFEVEVEEKPK